MNSMKIESANVHATSIKGSSEARQYCLLYPYSELNRSTGQCLE
jgi:hypothetical protein